MQQSFPRCPECQGVRAFFDYMVGGQRVAVGISRWGGRVELYACVCLECGYTTIQPLPDDMEKIRRAVEKRPHKN